MFCLDSQHLSGWDLESFFLSRWGLFWNMFVPWRRESCPTTMRLWDKSAPSLTDCLCLNLEDLDQSSTHSATMWRWWPCLVLSWSPPTTSTSLLTSSTRCTRSRGWEEEWGEYFSEEKPCSTYVKMCFKWLSELNPSGYSVKPCCEIGPFVHHSEWLVKDHSKYCLKRTYYVLHADSSTLGNSAGSRG